MAAAKTFRVNLRLRPVRRRNPAPVRRRAVRPNLDKRASPRLPSHQHPEQDRCRGGRLSRRLLNPRPVRRRKPALVRRRAAQRSRDKPRSKHRLRNPDLLNRQRLEQGGRRALQASPLPLHSNRWPDRRSRNP